MVEGLEATPSEPRSAAASSLASWTSQIIPTIKKNNLSIFQTGLLWFLQIRHIFGVF